MAEVIGYASSFTPIGTIVNGTTRFATTFTDGGVRATPRIIQLGNGTLVHYDGTSDAPTTPGTVSQEIFDTGGVTYYNTCRQNIGGYGTLTVSGLTGSSTAEAILINVEDTTPVQGNRARMWINLTWQIIDDWS
jgi:hypothetical protein